MPPLAPLRKPRIRSLRGKESFSISIRCSSSIPTVSPLLTPPTSHNILLLQSLLNSIPYRQDNVRRRQDEHRVGTAARGISERLSRVPRCVPSDGRPAGRVRRAL